MCNKTVHMIKTQGFTLVELSIVIIIIGFLIAGVTAGNSLIKQAKLHSIIQSIQSYDTAYSMFVARYNGLPGDLNNASSYWPTGCVVAWFQPNWCNGNGNGFIDNGTSEPPLSVKHLSLAGLVSDGIPPVDPSNNIVPTYLKGPTVNSSYRFMDNRWMGFNGNSLFLVSVYGDFFLGGALSGSEAFNIDQKIDNGSIDNNQNAIGARTGKFTVLTYGNPPIGCTTGFLENSYDLTSALASCGVSWSVSAD